MDQILLKKITSKNFRNISIDTIEFFKKLTCIYGENAQGKTNFLEMVYYLFNGKSFKKKCNFSELLTIDGEKTEFIISGVINENQTNDLISVKCNELNQTCYYNSEIIKSNKLGKNVFILVPSDAYNFFSIRTDRLAWLDSEISRLDNNYSKNLHQYNKAIRQRNILISSFKADKILLIAITKVIAPIALKIQNARIDYLEKINIRAGEIYKNLFSSEELMTSSYKPKIKDHSNCPEKYAEKWINYYKEECEKGITKYGPHLEDIEININGFPISTHGSLGQQKMAFLSLFFSGLTHNFEATDEHRKLLVLLDDISSEIDSLRLKSLIKYLLNQRCQIILTTANKQLKESIVNEMDSEVIVVSDGKFKIE